MAIQAAVPIVVRSRITTPWATILLLPKTCWPNPRHPPPPVVEEAVADLVLVKAVTVACVTSAVKYANVRPVKLFRPVAIHGIMADRLAIFG
jgi:hypothetical protein